MERPAKSKSDTCGHPTSSKAWTTRSICGHRYADHISNEQKSLSNGMEKDIGKYHAALVNIWNELTEEDCKQCENNAVEWNTKPLPDNMQQKYAFHLIELLMFTAKCRLSKTIPTEVMDFLKLINHRTGTVFIAFDAYTNVDGEQTYARYKYNGNGHIPVLIHY